MSAFKDFLVKEIELNQEITALFNQLKMTKTTYYQNGFITETWRRGQVFHSMEFVKLKTRLVELLGTPKFEMEKHVEWRRNYQFVIAQWESIENELVAIHQWMQE